MVNLAGGMRLPWAGQSGYLREDVAAGHAARGVSERYRVVELKQVLLGGSAVLGLSFEQVAHRHLAAVPDDCREFCQPVRDSQCLFRRPVGGYLADAMVARPPHGAISSRAACTWSMATTLALVIAALVRAEWARRFSESMLYSGKCQDQKLCN